MLTQIRNQDGYMTVKLSKEGKSRRFFVHHLVANAFLGERQDDWEINHIDFDRANNAATNLEWCSHRDNVAKSAAEGRYRLRERNGEKNPNYGNHKLADYYKEHPDEAMKLGRKESQNGKARPVMMFDKNMVLIKSFDWIGGCAEYLQSIGATTAKVAGIRDQILLSIKKNSPYLNYYFK